MGDSDEWFDPNCEWHETERDNKQRFYFHFRWKSLLGCPSSFSLDQGNTNINTNISLIFCFWVLMFHFLTTHFSVCTITENSTIISVDGFTGVMRLPTIRATCLLLFSNLRLQLVLKGIKVYLVSVLILEFEWVLLN